MQFTTVSLLFTGLPLLVAAIGRDGGNSLADTYLEEEWRKRITAVLIEQPEVIAIDNVIYRLENSALASALTKPVWQDRILGTNHSIQVPISCTWIANGNNVRLGADIARRRVSIRLIPQVSDPSRRIGFTHKLTQWGVEHRGELIWAACTLIRYGLEHGTSSRSMGSFEEWAQVMGAILHGCDIPGFLEHREKEGRASNPISEQWQPVMTAWWEGRGSELTTTSNLYELLATQGIELPECVRGESDEQKRVSLGKQLAKIRDRVFLIAFSSVRYQRVMVQRGEKSRTGGSQWRLQDISPDEDGQDG